MKLSVTIECHREGEHLHEVTVEADVSWDGEHRFDAFTALCVECEYARGLEGFDLTSLERQVAEDLLAERFEKAIAETDTAPMRAVS